MGIFDAFSVILRLSDSRFGLCFQLTFCSKMSHNSQLKIFKSGLSDVQSSTRMNAGMLFMSYSWQRSDLYAGTESCWKILRCPLNKVSLSGFTTGSENDFFIDFRGRFYSWGDLFKFWELLLWPPTMSKHTPCYSAYWTSVMIKIFSSANKIFWTNFYSKQAIVFSIFQVIDVLSEHQRDVQCTSCKLREISLLWEHMKWFMAPNSSLGKGFLADGKGSKQFKCVPH